MPSRRIVVIGSGPGGQTAAVYAAKRGCAVTVVERGRLGGVCLQRGCVPVKTMFNAIKQFTKVRDGMKFAVRGELSLDVPALLHHKDEVIQHCESGITALFAKYGITLVNGRAALEAPDRVTVGTPAGETMTLAADGVILATGGRTAVPRFCALDGFTVFDGTGALVKPRLSERMIIIGGGVLGCEFASLFAALGVRITVIEMMDHLMPGWDAEMARRLTAEFKRRGIEMHTGIKVAGLDVPEPGKVVVTLDGGVELAAGGCLVALGRKPNIENLGLEETGVALWEPPHGRGIRVDDRMRTTVPGVYAVGDVNGVRPLANVAILQAVAAVDDIFGDGRPVSYDAIPECFWGFPELSSVGLHEESARTAGRPVHVSRLPFRALGVSYVLGAEDGLVKVVSDPDDGTVLGVQICGPGAPELIAEAAVIVARKLTVDDVRAISHAHPTQGELIHEAIAAAGNLHTSG